MVSFHYGNVVDNAVRTGSAKVSILVKLYRHVRDRKIVSQK